MKYLSVALINWLAITTLFAQNFSPFVFPLHQTKSWDAIKLFNDTIYFSIGNDILSEGFSNRIVKVNKDLKYGVVSNFLPYSAGGKLFNGNNNLIWYSRTQDYRNTRNCQFSTFNNNGTTIGPVIIGDTSNDVYSIAEIGNDFLLSGDYRPPTSQFGWSGFLARYNLNGSKIWEKYYRINRDGFRTTSFDYVFHTKNNEILVIGRSQKDSAAVWQTKVISALFDTSGNLLEIKSELDSLGWQFDFVFNIYRLPRLYYNTCVQLIDSTYGLLIYNRESQLNFPARWVFFNAKGNVISHRKAWMYRDSINNPTVANIYFNGLIKSKKGNGYLAQFLLSSDSLDLHRMIDLDEDLYITKVYPGIPQFSNSNISAGLFAFTEDSEGNFYQLRSLNVDSISSTSTYGSLVCKVDRNGNLLSNGPLFPVGLNEQQTKSSGDLQVFPNPANGKITIWCSKPGEMQLEILNIWGELIQQIKFAGYLNCDLSGHSAGMYLFKFRDLNGNFEIIKVMLE